MGMNGVKRTSPLRLVGAAIQPFVYSWIACVLVGVLSFVLKADSPTLGDLAWSDVAQVATGWWLTAFGGSVHVDGTTVSLPPLLLTILTFMGLFGFVRRIPLTDWIDVLILAVTSAVTTFLIGLLAPDGSSSLGACVGSIVLACLAALLSRNRSDWFGSGFFTTPAGRVAYDGAMLTRTVLLAIAAASAVLSLVSLLLHIPDIAHVGQHYVLDIPSLIVFWIFQIMYLPTLILWAWGFMTGAGFAVGAGTHFSALGVTSAPLPAIPLFGALPGPTGTYWWAVLLPVVVAFIVGWRKASSFPNLSEAGTTGGAQILITTLAGGLLGFMASGSIGPERMAHVGTEPLAFALATALTVGLPLFLGLLAGNRLAKERYGVWMGKAKSKASSIRSSRVGKPASDDPAKAEDTAQSDTTPGTDRGEESEDSGDTEPGNAQLDERSKQDEIATAATSVTALTAVSPTEVAWDDRAPTAPTSYEALSASSPEDE